MNDIIPSTGGYTKHRDDRVLFQLYSESDGVSETGHSYSRSKYVGELRRGAAGVQASDRRIVLRMRNVSNSTIGTGSMDADQLLGRC